MISPDYLKRLEKGLKLDEAQRKAVGSILDKARPDLEKQSGEVRAAEKKLRGLQEGLEKSMRGLHESIREKLTDEQKERFDMMRLRQRKPGAFREGTDMRGVTFEPGELPPEVREKMERKRKAEDFPPERWEPPQDLEKGENLPPEIREHIEKRLKKRGQGEGQQRDLPPPEEWNDRKDVIEGE